jgi:deoxyribose-phosphate aldolase
MYLELNLYDEAANEEETLKRVFAALDLNVNGLCLPPFFLPAIQDIVPDGIVVSTPIDFPFGLQETKIRNHAVLSSVRRGASSIDLVMNHQNILNNKWKLIDKDIKSNYDICRDNGASLRCLINYRILKLEQRTVLLNLLSKIGVEYIITSTGSKMDSWQDNLLVSRHIEQKHGLFTISNGGLFSEEHYTRAKECKVFGCRVSSIPALEVFSGV